MIKLQQLFLSEGKLELAEEDNLIWKTVLRTGEWAKAPVPGGKLVVIRDGKSDIKNHIISLSEVMENFNDGAFEHVTVPLATNTFEGDHADIARNNTGFIRQLKIVEDNGVSKLKAGFDFTEPDVKEKVLRGTIPNTSVGIVYDFVRKSDAKKYAVALSHVALTHRPVIDKMEAFGVAASDDSAVEVEGYEPVEEQSAEEWKDSQGFEFIRSRIQDFLNNEVGSAYVVADLTPGMVKIKNTLGEIEWTTGYTIDDDKAVLPPVPEWQVQAFKKIDAAIEPEVEKVDEEETNEQPAPILNDGPIDDLQEAHLLRESRFAQEPNSKNGGIDMSDRPNLNGLNLSELPDDVRTAIEATIERNKELEREARKADVETKINEWSGELGLSDFPGFLKTARRIMLSDDGSTAGILLADDDNRQSEKVTATEIVEKLVDALPKNEKGRVNLAAQVTATGNDDKPDVDDNERPLDERLKEARQALNKE